MKTYAFPYGGFEWDSVIDIELTDEEAARLEASAKAEPRWHLDEDDSIRDICKKIERIIFEENKRMLTEDGRLDELREDLEDEYDDEDDMPTDDELVEQELGNWHVCYPVKLQNLEAEE